MAVSVIVECDVCKRQKQQTNHWYMAICASAAAGDAVPRLVIKPISVQDVDESTTVLCGEECVHKYVSQNLATLHKP